MLRRHLLRFAPLLVLSGVARGQPAVAPAPLGASDGASSPAELLGAAAEPYFRDWLNGFYARSLLEGLPQRVLTEAFSGLSPDPRVLARDGRQPEFARPVSDYVRGAVTASRIAEGRQRRRAVPQFDQIERNWGCPRDVLLAIWAMESGFGASQGDMDVVRSLATLAASGRRRDWAESELTAALRIMASGRTGGRRLLGSWAGAMGQTQMLPSVYLSDGVDADGDGRVDIWTSAADALGSAAKLLSTAGWRRGESWARHVRLEPGFDLSLSEGPRLTTDEWAGRGAVRHDGGPWGDADPAAAAQLLLPCGAQGPAFLAFPNHFVIRSYNNALAYALAIGLLADGFGGGDPLAIAWPHETPLSLEDRLASQTALASLGFDPGPLDGLIGARARAALRAWQKSQGIPADGYLSAAMVARLRVGSRKT